MLRTLTSARSAHVVLAVGIVLTYALLPLGALALGVDSPHLFKLAELSAIGAAFIVVGAHLPVPDLAAGLPRIRVRATTFLWGVWVAFAVFVLVAVATADRVPFVAALQGADPEVIVVLRERFLKAREGWESILVYLNALLAGALVPYALMTMLILRLRHRWTMVGVFLLYCVSFVEKAFFLKAALPLLYVVSQQRTRMRIRPMWIVAGAAALLIAVAVLAGAADRGDGREGGEFFSTSYAAQGSLVFLAWRAVVIPVLTAADALRVFEEEYGGEYLLGASSTLIAGVLGLERVAVERAVFAAQWGQTETETGSSNSLYITEAYMNFGMTGVIVFSLLLGAILRWFARSEDEALRSLWMLLAFGVFVGPLTGALFSNGFLVVMIASATLRLIPGEAVGPVPIPAEAIPRPGAPQLPEGGSSAARP